MAILFAGLLYIAEKTTTTFVRILYPLQFPVGLDSATYSHVHGKWEGRNYSLEADPARHMSRYQLWSLQELRGELLLSIHVAVLVSWDSWWCFMGISHFSAAGWDSHLAFPRGTCIIQQLQHNLSLSSTSILKADSFLPFSSPCLTIVNASNSVHYQRHTEGLHFS